MKKISILGMLTIVLILITAGCMSLATNSINLPADFQPGKEDFVDKGKNGRFLGIARFRGRNLKQQNGVNAFYVAKADKGRFKNDPIEVGDIIIGLEGEPLDEDAVYDFKKTVGNANKGDGFMKVTRWRKGKVDTFTLDLNPNIPDLTDGGVINKLHDWQLGPTGMNGWMHSLTMDNGATRDARQIMVTYIEKGSPADGKVQLKDVIIGVDGKKFNDDARKVLAKAIVKAEKKENKGKLNLMIWREGKEMDIVLNLKTLPDPSPTAPYNCAKTDAIIDAACDYLKSKELKPNWIGYINGLGMLASGRKDLMPKIKKFAHEICIPGEVLSVEKHQSMLCWTWTYKLIFLCEYYLKTNDKYVLPTIKEYATKLAMGQSGVGTWGHSVASRERNNGKIHGRLGGYGAINQMGLTAMIALPLAQKCGVDNKEIQDAIKRGDIFFSYYIDKGTIPYGDHKPNTQWFDDNGKSASSAIMFDLIGNKKGARFFSRMVLGSAPSGREAGHTGHFWSHLWGGLGAARSGKAGMIAFMKEMDPIFTMERGTAGNFVFQQNAGEVGKQGEPKTKLWDCTGARLLQLCVPREKIYLSGRDMKVADPVSPERIKELFAAGELYSNKKARKALSKKEIFKLLADEMPASRFTGARALRAQNLNCVDDLVKMLDSDNRFAQYGACYALKESGYGSQKAIKRLIELIETSDDLDLRLNAIDALTARDRDVSLASHAKSAIPALLRLSVKHFDIDPRRLLQRRLTSALFDRNGLITIHGIDDIDSSLLIPAIRELLTVDDGRARGSVASIYPMLKPEDRKTLWPDIYLAIKEISPSGIMFADQVRAKGLKLMAKNDIKEGVDLTIAFMSEKRWGQGWRQKAGLEVLKIYGPAAKKALPLLQEMKNKKKIKKEELENIDAVIKTIKTGKPRKLRSLNLKKNK